MTLLRITGLIGTESCGERELVVLQPSKGAYEPPSSACPGQDVGNLAQRLPRMPIAGIGAPPLPLVRLDLITSLNGWLAIGGELDGLVLTEDGQAIRQTAIFTRFAKSGPGDAIDLPYPQGVLDDVYIGFDGGWGNWYHWLCFALGRSALAAGMLDAATQIVLPE